MIDVAGFRGMIIRARQVTTAEVFRQVFEPQASPVIQNPNAIVAILQSSGADNRALQNRLFLIISADEHVDERNRRSAGTPLYSSRYFDRAINRTTEKQQ